ncbi:MAG TPA: glutaminyl-peptide cyclotransferase [Parvularculaceae bacterium]|nr:glutaminyl-peptide cyclotransferase [Parvularculaceae bacterium]
MKSRFSRSRAALAGAAAALLGCSSATAAPVYDVKIVKTFPHDADAFTEGLYFDDGYLYESTGLKGQSSLRKVDLETGKTLEREDLPADLFGEGIVRWKDEIIGLTWRSQIGFVYDRESFKTKRQFTYAGEGWGMTTDGVRLIMSDGTSSLRYLDPKTLAQTGSLSVTLDGKPLAEINELEWVDGEIYANIWQTDFIVRIDPKSGVVTGVIDARPLRRMLGEAARSTDVLNGIAYDAKDKRLFVTGKNWPTLFEIKLAPRAPEPPPN